MSSLYEQFRARLLYVGLSLIISPIVYFFCYLSSLVFFVFFGEPIALTYIHLLLFSIIYGLIILYIMHFAWKNTNLERKEIILNHILVFLIAFIICLVVFGSIFIGFGLII